LADVDQAIRQQAERLLMTPGMLRREAMARRFDPDWEVEDVLYASTRRN
jgi:hypothetical protein